MAGTLPGAFAIASFFGLTAAVFGAKDQAPGVPAGDRQAIGAIAEATGANRQAFDLIDCKFDVIQAYAASLDDAIQGRHLKSRPPRIRHGHWLVSGPYVRYELLCDAAVRAAADEKLKRSVEEARKASKSQFFASIECSDELQIQNNPEYCLSYSRYIAAANLYPPSDRDKTGIHLAPFNIGLAMHDESMRPATLLGSALAGHGNSKFAGSRSIRGQELLVVEVGEATRIGFDPARGYLPAYYSIRPAAEKRGILEAHLRDAKECSNGSWFPMTTIIILHPDAPPPFEVIEIRVTSLDTERPRPLDDFSLSLPAGTQVNVGGRPEWLNLSQDEVVRADRLKSLHERCIDHGREQAEFEAKASSAAGAPPASSWTARATRILGVNLVIVSIVGSIWYLRRRRRRTTSAV